MEETRKYKQTELGLLPEDWEVAKLGEKFRFISNNTFSRDFLCEDGDIKNIHYGDVLIKYGSTLDVSQSDIPAINSELMSSYSPKCFAEDGDIILADTAEDETVCKATELWNIGEKLVISGLHTMWCRPEQNTFAIKFLGYFMNTSLYHNQVLPLIQGIKVASVSKNAIQGTWLCIPPIDEQCRIASALTSIDNLLDSLDRLIAKKRDIKQGAMQQLLSGKKRLKGFTKPWVEKKLGDVVDVKRGVRVVKGQLAEDGLFPVFQNTNIPLGYFNKNNVKAGTPFVIIGGSAGQIGIYETDYWAADDCAYFDCGSTMSNKFLYFLLLFHQREIQGNVRSASVPRLDRKALIELFVSVPSLPEQQAIASVLTSMDNELSALEAKRKKYEQIKQGMMQQLLTGRISLN